MSLLQELLHCTFGIRIYISTQLGMVNNILKINFIAVFMILIPVLTSGQMNSDTIVWPGDINNNGVVNHIDALYIGAAFGTQGGARDTASINWEGVFIPNNWQGVFPSSDLSFAFADCNGNGIVDENDLNAIDLNYGFEHDLLFPDSFPLSGNMGDTELFFDIVSNPVAMPGESISVPVSLGGQNFPVDDFYGLAFSVQVNTDYIDMESIIFDFENSWIDPLNEGLITYQRRGSNVLDVVVSRRTMTTTSGGGAVGILEFIIEGDVPDFAPNIEVLTIGDVYVVDQNLYQTYATVGTNNLYLDITNPIKELPKDEFSIYPNPVSEGVCTIQGLEKYIDAEVRLLDIAGRQINAELVNNDLLVGNLPTGIYFINISTPQGILTEKIFINN